MKVVLTADVEKLGRRGEVKEVADGYARNFLIPRSLATPATRAQLNRIQQASEAQARKAARAESDARALAARIDATEVRVKARVGEHGRLYGSVTNADVAEGLSAALGVPIERRQVDLEDPIRQAGEHKVRVRVARGVDATARVLVEPE